MVVKKVVIRKGERFNVTRPCYCNADYPDLVDNSYARSCDINYIVSQVGSTNELAFNKQAFYGDVSDSVYHSENGDFDNYVFPNTLSRAIQIKQEQNEKDFTIKKEEVKDTLLTDLDKDQATGSGV